jgi:ATP-dependent DNA helicase RecG
MPDKVIEILRAKYLVSAIRYEGLQRIEELEYPEASLREAILNAIVHKDYTGAQYPPHQPHIFHTTLLI